jgi:phosphate acetyltransferase
MSNRGTGKYEQLLDRCRNPEAIPTAVAQPCKASALAGAMEAAGENLIRPILVGPEVLYQTGRDL